jgi:hypothetical protein
MRRAAILALAVACATLGACSRDLDPTDPEPTTVSLKIQNDGPSTAYVYRACVLDFTITSLANPSVPINRVEGCAVCECSQTSCPICGACYEAPEEIAAGGQLTESWLTVNVTTENRKIGSCQRLHALPAGSYRIELPVYRTQADAAAKVLPRVITQVFTLPAPDDTVAIPIGVGN